MENITIHRAFIYIPDAYIQRKRDVEYLYSVYHTNPNQLQVLLIQWVTISFTHKKKEIAMKNILIFMCERRNLLDNSGW
jgi:hypothetical protein